MSGGDPGLEDSAYIIITIINIWNSLILIYLFIYTDVSRPAEVGPPPPHTPPLTKITSVHLNIMVVLIKC